MLLHLISKLFPVNFMTPILLEMFSPPALIIILGCIALVILAVAIFFGFKLKKKKQEVVEPITGIIGDDPERLEELNKDLEPFGFAYDPNEDVFYSIMNGWQREFGYCRLYDEASAPLSMIIDCEPIRFEYEGKKWLIEFWKGQYGMTTGGEVGLYYTTGPEINIPGVFNGTFYYCVKDEDRINMSYAFRKNGNLLFTRSGLHWWITGFKLGEFSQPSELTMDIILKLPTKQMMTAFVQALRKVGYREPEYSVKGRSISIHFAKPHSRQPFSRTPLTTFIMQKNNESFCKSYQYLTREYPDTLDKLEIVRRESPGMYRQILHMGKIPQVFDGYYNMKSFLKKEEERE
ncbi:MAG: hypothetical protein K0S47_898 [Herbinix sp.]|nr:hypothetical protein [Herbinix sp.]